MDRHTSLVIIHFDAECRVTRERNCTLFNHSVELRIFSVVYVYFDDFSFLFRRVMKYILVTGGVISGIGKGIVASSVGTLLKACGQRVTSIKIDPYINIDAGTFSPYEHGELIRDNK